MELTPLKDEVKLKAIRVPAVLPLPEDLVGRFTRDEWKVFGHFCNKNPELDCMSDPVYLRNVAKCIKATANGKLDDVIRDPLKMTSHPLYKKWSAYYQGIKDKKALERKDPKVKAATKARNETLKAKYGTCEVDGVEEPLQSYALEPEGIFPGRPGSPDAGLWKEATDIAEVVVNAKTFLPKLLIGDDDTEHTYSWNLSFNPENHYAARYPVRVGVPGEKPTSVQWKKIMFSAKASCKKEGQQKKYDASEVLIDNIVPLMDKIVRDCEENPLSLFSRKAASQVIFVYHIKVDLPAVQHRGVLFKLSVIGVGKDKIDTVATHKLAGPDAVCDRNFSFHFIAFLIKARILDGRSTKPVG